MLDFGDIKPSFSDKFHSEKNQGGNHLAKDSLEAPAEILGLGLGYGVGVGFLAR